MMTNTRQSIANTRPLEEVRQVFFVRVWEGGLFHPHFGKN